MNSPATALRAPENTELGILTALALRSKAHWGYSPEFMEACRDELTLCPDSLESGSIRLIEVDGRPAGFYSLEPAEDDPLAAELDLFFVEPEFIGRGLGRIMMNEAFERAARSGFERLLVQSDPHAEDFYRAMGFVCIGHRPSASLPGRMLPLLQVEFSPRA